MVYLEKEQEYTVVHDFSYILIEEEKNGKYMIFCIFQKGNHKIRRYTSSTKFLKHLPTPQFL